jgi:diadenosine tetraphosphate (Ap4A) HIT family hydrolase
VTPGCLFCDPTQSRILCESENWYVRHDNYPATPGHVEIVPRDHIASTVLLTSEDWAALGDLITEAKHLIRREHGPVDGWNVGVNEGKAAGQTIGHLHIHLIPRRHGDQPDPRGGIRRGLPNGDPDAWTPAVLAQKGHRHA